MHGLQYIEHNCSRYFSVIPNNFSKAQFLKHVDKYNYLGIFNRITTISGFLFFFQYAIIVLLLLIPQITVISLWNKVLVSLSLV